MRLTDEQLKAVLESIGGCQRYLSRLKDRVDAMTPGHSLIGWIEGSLDRLHGMRRQFEAWADDSTGGTPGLVRRQAAAERAKLAKMLDQPHHLIRKFGGKYVITRVPSDTVPPIADTDRRCETILEAMEIAGDNADGWAVDASPEVDAEWDAIQEGRG